MVIMQNKNKFEFFYYEKADNLLLLENHTAHIHPL